MRRRLKTVGFMLLWAGCMGRAQQAAGEPDAASRQPTRPAMERTLQGALSGRWWTNPQIVARLGLTPAQQKKIDDIFQQDRLKLIDLTAALDKEEALLEPMVGADQPDATKIRAQVDRITQARGELEKANANMLLGIRLVLTPNQWRGMQVSGPQARRLQHQNDEPPEASPTGSAPTPKKQH
jgi:protein CpxP